MNDPIIGLIEGALDALAKKFESQNESRAEAERYVSAIIDEYPKTKLPQLVALEPTQKLMAKFDISKNMLSTTLTAARAKRKADEAKPEVKVPPRKRRSKPKDASPKPMESSSDLLSGVNASSTSPSGRIENGNIGDL